MPAKWICFVDRAFDIGMTWSWRSAHPDSALMTFNDLLIGN